MEDAEAEEESLPPSRASRKSTTALPPGLRAWGGGGGYVSLIMTTPEPRREYRSHSDLHIEMRGSDHVVPTQVHRTKLCRTAAALTSWIVMVHAGLLWQPAVSSGFLIRRSIKSIPPCTWNEELLWASGFKWRRSSVSWSTSCVATASNLLLVFKRYEENLPRINTNVTFSQFSSKTFILYGPKSQMCLVGFTIRAHATCPGTFTSTQEQPPKRCNGGHAFCDLLTNVAYLVCVHRHNSNIK